MTLNIKERLLKQAKPWHWLGGMQIQLSQAMANYLMYVNLSFMGLMFWHTTAAPWLRQFYGGASLWHFALFMLLLVATVMLLDVKYIYPSRQAFLNSQAYKHDNPAVRDLKQILKNQEVMRRNIEAINEKLDKRHNS